MSNSQGGIWAAKINSAAKNHSNKTLENFYQTEQSSSQTKKCVSVSEELSEVLCCDPLLSTELELDCQDAG